MFDASAGSLREVTDRLTGMDLDALGDAALAETTLEVRRELDRLECVFARLAVRAHRRGVASADGSVSTQAWLRRHVGMREGDARAAIEAGEAAGVLPATREAWAGGDISTGAARVIFAARVPGCDDQLAACEGALVEVARQRDARGLQRAVAHFRNLATAGDDERALHGRRGVALSRTLGGMVALDASLDPDLGETVLAAIHAYTDPPRDGDGRTPAQRRADALGRVARAALGALPAGVSARPQVSLVVDWETVTAGRRGRCDGELVGPIGPAAVRRSLCDSAVARVVTGPQGLPLDVGRSTRTVPPPMRRALVVRDGGCRFPGCDRPPGWCEAHHVVHWIAGGATSLENLVLLCDRHHHLVHERGWTAKFDGQELRIVRPDGLEVS